MASVFLYGTLQPGQKYWRLVEPHAVGEPRRASVAGQLFDCNRGHFPAMILDESGNAPGTVVDVTDEVTLLRRLDAYEGPRYERVQVVADDGTTCLTYVWAREINEWMIPLPFGSAWSPLVAV